MIRIPQELVGRAAQAVIDLNGPGRYVHWGFIQISVANVVVICLMIVVFVAAILVPFPRHGGDDR
ncbi:MAG: hypothetical protein WAL35_01070 [Acidimicrobiales bacterium]